MPLHHSYYLLADNTMVAQDPVAAAAGVRLESKRSANTSSVCADSGLLQLDVEAVLWPCQAIAAAIANCPQAAKSQLLLTLMLLKVHADQSTAVQSLHT